MSVPAPSILIVAGEASADQHGSHVLQALLRKRPDVAAFGVGGRSLRDTGFEAIIRAERMAVAGLTEVLLALPRMWLFMRRLVQACRSRKPKVAVLIDLPDFNLRLAKRLKKLGIPVVYFVSPQLWAWRQKRVEQVRAYVDQMLVILPFEQEFYRRHGVRVQFVGHPLAESLPASVDREETRQALRLSSDQTPVVALLPGSRRQEVERHLPTMLASLRLLRRSYPQAHALLPVASTLERASIERLVAQAQAPVTVLDGRATEAIGACDVAVVCSGTATLQTALLGRPMVVVYKVSWLTFQILRRMIKVAHIGLVNLIAGRRLMPELVQADFTPERVAQELTTFLQDPTLRLRLSHELSEMRKGLTGVPTAERVAQVIHGYLDASTSGAQRDRASAG